MSQRTGGSSTALGPSGERLHRPPFTGAAQAWFWSKGEEREEATCWSSKMARQPSPESAHTGYTN